MGDLQVFPVSIPGGINHSAPIPTEADLDELKNFVPYRGRLSLRGPLQLVATIQDDQGTPADVTAILDIIEHGGAMWTASWSSVTQKVYLHSMTYAGGSINLRGALWTGVASKPTITLTSFEGGAAETPVSRIFAADYANTLATKVWNGTTISTLTEDLDNSGVAEDLKFGLMIAYKYHLWGTGFFEGTVLRPEMIRFSQPGMIPCTDGAGGANPKEWISADHRSVGNRGEKIRALSRVADRMLVFQDRATHVIHGSGATNWTRQELSSTIGAVGPFAVASADNRVAYFWSLSGPYRTDGSEIQYIGDPIQDIITGLDAAELSTVVGYSPDEGLVHFIVTLTGADAYKLSLVFDHRAGRWLKHEWLVGTSTALEVGTIVALDRS